MKPKNWSELLETLGELHAVAPDYRFGQLICNLATLVGESEVVFAWDAEDEDLVAAGRRFLEAHRRLGREDCVVGDRWPELLVKVGRLGEEYRGVRFGEMVGHLATAVRGPEVGAMWDVEDDELIAVADRWLAHRKSLHEAEASVARMHREFEAERRGSSA